jgi:general secretion pathway protein D
MQTGIRLRRSSRVRGLLVGAACILTAGGCAERDVAMPHPLTKPPSTVKDIALVAGEVSPSSPPAGMAITPAPSVPLGSTISQPLTSQPMPHIAGENISVNFDGINVGAFINTVFGELLKVSFEISPPVATKDVLVHLRTAEPMSPDAFLKLVIEVLRNYNIGVVYQNNVFRVIEAGNVKQDVPRIIRARAVPNMPDDMRPTFMFIQLHNVTSQFMLPWLGMAFKDRLQFQGVNEVNGVLVIGTRDDVRAAVDAIEVLDQPTMAGSRSMKIVPSYWSAQKLVDQLLIVLKAEGYAVALGAEGGASIKLVPIPALNYIILFTPDDKAMRHILEWVSQLDQPGQTVNTKQTYYYQVQNTSAKILAETLGRVMGGVEAGSANGSPAPTPANVAGANAPGTLPSIMQPGNVPAPPLSFNVNRQVAVDGSHNAIIFTGTAEEFSQFRALALQMDRAPLEVLIEATIAEVTLTEGDNLGVTLDYNDANALVPITSAVQSDAGLVVNLIRDRGRFLANLNASANKNKVSILSSPRVVASSGQKAAIKVGTEVPILTTQQQAPGTVGGTSTILQDVQYRSTGVLLTIDPTVNSNRRVELNIQQEVSEAQANKISDVSSPAIFSRSIQTTLSLRDGETVLLGGLISENYSRGNTGIPYLKDIPVLGNLFKTSSRGRTRIELIVLLTPYIIDGPDAANAVRDAFVHELTQLPTIPVSNGAP